MVAFDELAKVLVAELTAASPQGRLLGAWLSGSCARGAARAGSDIDLAVMCDAALDPAVVRTVVGHRLGDFEALCKELVSAS